ncbi:Glucan endo-1,3-alpha-glucosidase agn1 [Cytospora paraplurivora]|uniref:Glucan endo-1,3-alpha-glucosidase agn1 n=1 Tax=Cytospora paraplurivora TaxID=2898453 RepID=A0AAN9U3S9_9PEZI
MSTGTVTVYSISITTITVTPSPVTISEASFSNVNISSSMSSGFSFQPYLSISVPYIEYPVTIVTSDTTTVTTRNLTLPPWPEITSKATGSKGSSNTLTGTGTGTGTGSAESSTLVSTGSNKVDTPTGTESTILKMESVTKIEADTLTTTTTHSSTSVVLPVWTTWPPALVKPVTDEVDDIVTIDDEDGRGSKVPCNIWFLDSSCSPFTYATMPLLTQKRGPPPASYFDMAGWDFPDPLPPWPKITQTGETCEDTTADIIVYPKANGDADVDTISALLKSSGLSYNQLRTAEKAVEGDYYTAFFHVTACPESLRLELENMDQVSSAYDYAAYQKEILQANIAPTVDKEDAVQQPASLNLTHWLQRRDAIAAESFTWALSEISAPSGTDWLNDLNYVRKDADSAVGYYYNYHSDKSAGKGQYIYILENVAACAAGANLGTASAATLILAETGGSKPAEAWMQCNEKYLEALVNVVNDVYTKNRQGTSVINMSWTISAGLVPPQFARAMRKSNLHASNPALLKRSAALPQYLLKGKLLLNLLVVGATDKNARRASFSEGFSDTATFNKMLHAPGDEIIVPDAETGGYAYNSGTSFSTPLVAGLVAYLRGLDSGWAETLESPAGVRKMLKFLQRKLTIDDSGVVYSGTRTEGDVVPFIWNGQILTESCLLNGLLTDADGNPLCPNQLRVCATNDKRKKRSTCTLPDDDAGDDSSSSSSSSSGSSTDNGLQPSPITWQHGTPSPTCTTSCGQLCSGYYCVQDPTGTPADYTEPKITSATAAKTTSKSTITSKPTTTSKTTTTSKPTTTTTASIRMPSRSARWDLMTYDKYVNSKGIYKWLGYDDDEGETLKEFLSTGPSCDSADWIKTMDSSEDYPSNMTIDTFFKATDCLFLLDVSTQAEWQGLSNGDLLGSVVCDAYDYADCFKASSTTAWACGGGSEDGLMYQWAYCTWDHWFE